MGGIYGRFIINGSLILGILIPLNQNSLTEKVQTKRELNQNSVYAQIISKRSDYLKYYISDILLYVPITITKPLIEIYSNFTNIYVPQYHILYRSYILHKLNKHPIYILSTIYIIQQNLQFHTFYSNIKTPNPADLYYLQFILLSSHSVIIMDPDQLITASNYPLALKQALIHRRVTMVGNIKLSHKQNNNKFTCCCCKRVLRKPQPINFKMADIGFIGPGYTLYFMFNRLCLFLILGLTLLMKIHQNLFLAVQNIFHLKKLRKYEFLGILVVTYSFLLIYFFQKRMADVSLTLDENQIDPEDYSIWVKNIPIQFVGNNNIEQVIKQYFEEKYGQQLKVSSICLCYNLVPLGRFLSRKKQQLSSLKKYRSQKQKRQRVSELLFKSQKLPFEGINDYHGVKTLQGQNMKMGNFQSYTKQKIVSLNQFINFSYHRSSIMFIGQAIISFQSVWMRDLVLSKSQHSYFYGNKLQIENAPNPKDIFWHNLHLESEDYRLRRIFSIVSCIALIFTTLSIRTFFSWIQLQIQGTKYESSLLKSSTSAIIIVMNIFIQGFFLKQLSHYEGHRTKVKNLTKFSFKCISLQVLTCLIVPYLAAYFIFQMKQKQTYLEKMDDLIYGNSIVSLILLGLSHKTLIKSLKIKLFQFGGWRLIPKNILTIRELCSLYELPQFEIQLRYSQTIKNTLLTFCFFTMVPKAVYYTMGYLFFVYYLDKYNLVRRRSVLVNIDDKMNLTMLRILYLSTPMYLTCEMIYQKQVSFLMLSVLVLSLYLIFRLLRVKRRQKKKDKAQEMTFWEANIKYFHTDYKRENPALLGVSQDEFQQKIIEMNLEMNLNQNQLSTI